MSIQKTENFFLRKNFYSVWIEYNKNVNYKPYFKNSLEYIFKPKSIAIIGATERKGSVGNSLVNNLIKGENNYKLHFVNIKGSKIYNRESYKSLKDIKDDFIHLAVVAVPRDYVLKTMEELKYKNVRGVIIITAGFKETGEDGLKLEKKIIDIAKNNNIRIIGPNCLGIIHSYHNMNASFADSEILKGHFSLISQSGAICSAALDLSLQHNIGFSHFISVGSMCDVQFYELIEYLFYDDNTKYILLYVESIGDMNRFMETCKRICLYKPIIVLKSGKTAKAAEAAISHTGSMVGNYEIFYASMKKLGVLVAENFEELFNICKILNLTKYPETNEICVVTNAGGPGVLLVDCIVKNDGSLTNLNNKLKSKLDKFLPNSWSKANPIDILGDASPELYKKTIETLALDEQYKNIVVLLSPQSVTDPLKTAQEIINLKNHLSSKNKLILCNYLGGASLEKSSNILNKNNIPTFVHPEHSVQNLLKLYQNIKHIQGLYQEIPNFLATDEENYYINNLIRKNYNFNSDNTGKSFVKNIRKDKAVEIIKKAFENKNYILNEYDSKRILETYDIPVVNTKIYKTLLDVENADNINYPCAMKIYSDTITHKKDIGGVILNINSKEELINAYKKIYENVQKHKQEKGFQGVTIQNMIDINDGIELILGYYYDKCFGPVLLFGSGGSYVEIFKDAVLLIPPATYSYTHHTIKQTKIYNALLGNSSRFKKCDISKLITTIMNFSELVSDLLPYINESDINPLFASGNKMIALDARFTLRKSINFDSKNELYDKIGKKYPIDLVMIHNENPNLDNFSNYITRPIHEYDFKLIRKFIKNNLEELNKNTFFFVNKDHVVSDMFSYQLCNCNYELYNVILNIKNNNINGLVKIEKKNDLHCYIYAKDKSTFSILIDQINTISKKNPNSNSSFIYIKKNSNYIDNLKNAGYSLNHEQDDVACYIKTI
ncbi:succinyl-CoA ligase, putative [Plasmodium berghei]|uniref:Succinyl-CoA ligase, putative n=2 Tax=Plasmodium berghei TaxID=5821 RepID=A0A509AHT8_PLABA|nr:succinyl-CoA ligase, putative [Plasmodium berghei ANKA]CXI17830.1 succinyl-CoA ligase, putative [Plasmodium berghei]SCM19728.1 succinyl-CoA ligase, putative [Plasmodium berghei]SCN23464.1 succinyl-CoA ligase, putative [Plasmodium berghei]SCO59098.1 succinyl-CoA ligase, putative [Plasmodium berghei]SCO59769.1 succinyl-CoA ligase, putative [Plasmodium berghei]|eukprot:XP_034420611.1 succinyl-CoA ligase, putative [Plasmodium berghei ANKA]